MCINPKVMPARPDWGYEGGLVGCRVCWQCLRRRVDDYAGRCIAEARYSASVLAVTLTYSDRALEGRSLMLSQLYPDVQRMLKRLRMAGHVLRYLCAGEYGAKNGRPHFHIVLFLKGGKPFDEVAFNCNVNWPDWPHGFSLFQEPDYGGYKYLLKYVLKQEFGFEKSLAMSKNPIIGFEFIEKLAAAYAQQGLLPQSASYQLDGIKDHRTGKHVQFSLSRRGSEIFRSVFLANYEGVYSTEYLDKFLNYTFHGVKPWGDDDVEMRRIRSLRSGGSSGVQMPFWDDEGFPMYDKQVLVGFIPGRMVPASEIVSRYIEFPGYPAINVSQMRDGSFRLINGVHVCDFDGLETLNVSLKRLVKRVILPASPDWTPAPDFV